LAKNLNTTPKPSPTEKPQPEVLQDLWADEGENIKCVSDKIRKIREKNPIEVARIVLPSSGLSYNPSFKAHQALLDEIVQ
jgi:hypothetical protein